jgi:hypothetical protein
MSSTSQPIWVWSPEAVPVDSNNANSPAAQT